MKPLRFVIMGLMFVAASWSAPARAADGPLIEFQAEPGRIRITAGGEPVATYVYRDGEISRPYFAHLFAPGGTRVSRNHPPVEGKDPTDHATLHPGLWLAFGDLSGADCWRNKARVEHERFVEAPRNKDSSSSFTVANQYLSSDGTKAICHEICRYTIAAKGDAFAIVSDSQFRSDETDFAFGDQEEMGLGVRLATPLAVKQGGRMINSEGDSGEKAVRGKTAAWCDGRGVIAGKEVGIAVMADPANFRPSWFHARDYGLIVANPFGRKALTKGEESKLVVRRGETFRIRFGVVLHASSTTHPTDIDAVYRDMFP